MAIIIRHLDGPLAGKVHEFGDSVESIVFGRSPECEVSYPADFMQIAMHHLRLRRSSAGDYILDVAPRCYVEVDGVSTTNGHVIASTILIRLGGHDGPSCALEIQSERMQASMESIERAPEPTMEGILASIRRIISDDESSSARQRTALQSQPDDEGLEAGEGEADDEIINDIARVLSGSGAQAAQPAPAAQEAAAEEEAEYILDLTAELGGLELVEEVEDIELVEVVEPVAEASASEPSSEVEAPEVEPAPAAPRPMSASEEAASALERAIAALRAGQVPTSSSPFAFQPSPKGASESKAALRTEMDDADFFAKPEGGVVRGTRKESQKSWSLEKESSRAAFAAFGEAIVERSEVLIRDRVRRHLSETSANTVVGGIKGLLRPMLRRWLSENLPKVLRDLVDVSVFGPRAVRATRECLVQVFLHQPEHCQAALSLAKETDPEATRKGVPKTLFGAVERGQNMEIVLDGRGLEVEEGRQFLTWNGQPCGCQFRVTAPNDAEGRAFHPRVVVLANSVPLGSVNFTLTVAEEDDHLISALGRFRRYTYAFLSYASPDRAEVIRRAQMLRLMGIDFFSDLLSIEPGELWMQRLYAEIDRCDVFCLFWSSQAKVSEWVLKELDHALARGAANDGVPDIVPVIIEGPPPPPPPEQLKHLHFNDWMLYVLAGEQRGAGAAH